MPPRTQRKAGGAEPGGSRRGACSRTPLTERSRCDARAAQPRPARWRAALACTAGRTAGALSPRQDRAVGVCPSARDRRERRVRSTSDLKIPCERGRRRRGVREGGPSPPPHAVPAPAIGHRQITTLPCRRRASPALGRRRARARWRSGCRTPRATRPGSPPTRDAAPARQCQLEGAAIGGGQGRPRASAPCREAVRRRSNPSLRTGRGVRGRPSRASSSARPGGLSQRNRALERLGESRSQLRITAGE